MVNVACAEVGGCPNEGEPMQPATGGSNAKARDIEALRNHDRPALMPGHGPVRGGGLVEENRPDRTSCFAKHRGGQSADRPRGRKERPERRDPLQSDPGVTRLPIGNGVYEFSQESWIERSTDPQCPTLREGRSILI
jgi:hypothetical protein